MSACSFRSFLNNWRENHFYYYFFFYKTKIPSPAITDDEELLKSLEEQYGSRITDGLIVLDTSKLRNLYEKRKKYFEEWKKAKHYEGKTIFCDSHFFNGEKKILLQKKIIVAHTGERTMITVPKLGVPIGGKEDSIHYYERKVKKKRVE